MKKLFLLSFFLASCMSNNASNVNSFNPKNLYEMTVEEYKEMLINYNQNQNFPDMDK